MESERLNRAIVARLCRVPEIAIGTNVRDIRVELCDLEGRRLALDDTPRMRALRGETVSGAVVRVVYPDGDAAWVEVNAGALAGDDGESYGCLITYEDVSERFEAERRARHEADHDPLTGTANRRALDRMLAAAVARAGRAGHSIAVLVMERDLVARVGGDEFVIVLADLEPGSAAGERCRTRVAAALAAPWLVAGVDVPLRAAIGVAHHPADGRDGGTLIARADRAMYAAKAAAGR